MSLYAMSLYASIIPSQKVLLVCPYFFFSKISVLAPRCSRALLHSLQPSFNHCCVFSSHVATCMIPAKLLPWFLASKWLDVWVLHGSSNTSLRTLCFHFAVTWSLPSTCHMRWLRAVLIRIPNRKQKQESLSGMFSWISIILNHFQNRTETGSYQSHLNVWQFVTFVTKMWSNLKNLKICWCAHRLWYKEQLLTSAHCECLLALFAPGCDLGRQFLLAC